MLNKKRSRPSDVAEEIQYMQKIKDIVAERKTKGYRASIKFLKRYVQELEITFAKPQFLRTVLEIREKLGVPRDGFNVYDNENEFKLWLEKSYKDAFKKMTTVLAGYSEIIKTNPEEILDFLVTTIFHDHSGENKDSYYYKDDLFAMGCSFEAYENYITEKPFPGIFQFILFDDIFLPAQNFTRLFYRDNYVLLAIPANATKRDLMELWSEIQKDQKEMVGYAKNKKRLKKNLTEGLEALAYDQKTTDEITTEKLDGEQKKNRLAERSLDIVDQNIYGGKIPLKPNLEKERKFRRKRSKIKSQAKKLVDAN